jgi:integrase
MRIETPTGTLELAGTIRSTNKGNRQLLTKMRLELAAILSGWLAAQGGQGHEPLVHYANGKPYQVGAVERMCRLWGEAAQVADCTPHRWRHTFATTLLRQGTPLEVI